MRNEVEGGAGKDKPKASCQCPFCDSPVEETYPFCKACGRKMRRCSKCGRALAHNEEVCPQCKE
jgi:predicted amidophosphoribosyltransferase